MVSTVFKIEKGIGIRNASRPQAKFLSSGADLDGVKGGVKLDHC